MSSSTMRSEDNMSTTTARASNSSTQLAEPELRRYQTSEESFEAAQDPVDIRFDSSFHLLFDPYLFVSKTCKSLRQDVFQTRIMLEKTICISGPEAAKIFYNNDLMVRRNVAPGFVRKTLFGEQGVQALDGEAHRHRKQMFVDILMSKDRIKQLCDTFETFFMDEARKFTNIMTDGNSNKVNLYSMVQVALTRAVCAWSGVPLEESEVKQTSDDLTALFDAGPNVGPRNLWGRFARWRLEKWISNIIEKVRDGKMKISEETALHQIAFHRDDKAELLDLKIAAVELLNVLRPTVAIAVNLIFIALAFHDYPEWREKLASDSTEVYSEWFAQEIRRYYPFFPVLIARVQRNFVWNGFRFPKERLVILDLYGTNHDARTWEDPEKFNPERFRSWDKSEFNFIPQGGGSYTLNHRCPGEFITVEIMKSFANLLASGRVQYQVPSQDFSIEMSRMPAIPRSQFLVTNLQVRNTFSPPYAGVGEASSTSSTQEAVLQPAGKLDGRSSSATSFFTKEALVPQT